MAERGKARQKAKYGGVKRRGRSSTARGNGAAKARRLHNSGGELPDEVYERHLRSIDSKWRARQKAHAEFKQKDGEYRAAKKLAKDDGCNIGAIDLARDLDKRDQADVALLYRDTGRVLRLMESNLATQLELFAGIDLPDPESPVLAGEAAGKRGDPRDNNPHRPGTDEYEQYDVAWQKGQEALAGALGRG